MSKTDEETIRELAGVLRVPRVVYDGVAPLILHVARRLDLAAAGVVRPALLVHAVSAVVV